MEPQICGTMNDEALQYQFRIKQTKSSYLPHLRPKKLASLAIKRIRFPDVDFMCINRWQIKTKNKEPYVRKSYTDGKKNSHDGELC